MSSRQIPAKLSIGFRILVERFFTLANAGLLVALALLIWPYLASAFYLYQGRNILERALREQGLESSDWEVIAFAPINLYSNGLQAKLNSSVGYMRRATRWDVTNAEAYNTMAKIHYLQGDLLLAIDALSKVNELRPANPLIQLTLGDIYDGLGLAEEAVAEYERSQMELRGTRVGERAEVNYLKLADAYLKAGDPNRALPVLQKILTIDPHNPYALYHFAKICETLGEGERLLAQGLYEQLYELRIPTWGDKRLYGYLAPLVPQLVDERVWSVAKANWVVSSLISQPSLISDLVDGGIWSSHDLLRLAPFADSNRARAALLQIRSDTVTVIDFGAMEKTKPYKMRGGFLAMPWSGKILQVTQIEPGAYRVKMQATGTPVKGIFPRVLLTWKQLADNSPLTMTAGEFHVLAERLIGEFDVDGSQGDTYLSNPVEVPAQQVVVLELAFINDKREGGEDRNVKLYSLEIVPVHQSAR